ncbi:coiled-coil domain-containing protein 74B-like isoform X2 [Hemicordylus capensis]|uniref:coiled-coil domain-containing protein 74B-like isoform X2 n=1 Tax=Hemicordylus capensis TaxID=884348 RepID=UPI0023046C7C|nr:coiled-coil domain-containing protein 74B-like isoform X2 [Hemicordylus capensis]
MQNPPGLPPLWPERPPPAASPSAAALRPLHHPHPPPPPPPVGSSRWGAAAAAAARTPEVAELERSLQFLQQQHADTLGQLHREIDRLQRQNKDLQYRLIMNPAFQNTDSDPGSSKVRSRGSSLKVAFSLKGVVAPPAEVAAAAEEEEEEEEYGKAVAANGEDLLGFEGLEEQEVSSEFTKEEESLEGEEEGPGVPEELKAPSLKQEVTPPRETAICERTVEVCDRATSPIDFPSPSQSGVGEVKIPSASSNPFLANVLPSHMRKPPTLEECEVVIRQLWNINHMQVQELMYLRSCLEDIHRTKRIPDDYMLAGQLGSHTTTRLPRVKNVPRKWLLNPLPAAERAVLPALKQTLGNAFAERQKRTQAVQRNRLNRTAL